MSTNTHTENEENETMPESRTAKLSLSHWLFIIAIPIGIIGACYLFWNEEKTRINVYVLARELPAYHQIQSGDIVPKSFASRSLSSGVLNTDSEIVGRYTLTPLSQDQPLMSDQLGAKLDPTCLSDKIVVSLPATPAMTFGGNLKAGDLISITFGTPINQNAVSPSPNKFPDVLVLDVKAVSQTNASPAFILVIAIPKDSAQAFATHLNNPAILISRSLANQTNPCIVKNP